MDALNRTAVDGFLDLLLRGPCRVVNLGEILIVQAKDFRANLGAKTARDALILVDHWNFGHTLSSLKYENSESHHDYDMMAEQRRTVSATLPEFKELIPLRANNGIKKIITSEKFHVIPNTSTALLTCSLAWVIMQFRRREGNARQDPIRVATRG